MANFYLSAYFIFNVLLIIIYPILRNSGNKYMLTSKDNWGYKKEDSIIGIVATILLLRYVRYFTNWEKFFCETFFCGKFAISFLLLLMSRKIAVWYLLACTIIWLLIKYPRYNGPSNIVYIPNEHIFAEYLNLHMRKPKDKKSNNDEDHYLLMIFYSNYSFDCLYTEELFADISIKYYHPNLLFGRMDVDLNENLVSQMGINLKGFKVTLPYLIMFKNGKEIHRLPGNDAKGFPKKMKNYREREIVDVFELKKFIASESN